MKSLKFSLLLMLITITIAFSQQFVPKNEPLVPLQDRHGNALQLHVDPKTGSADHVYGQLPNIGIYGFQSKGLSKPSVEQLSKKFFSDYAYILKIDTAQTKLIKVETNGQMWFVSYRQSVNDVPVYGTEIGYTLNQNGDVIGLGAHAYQNISISTTPKMTKSDAEAVAKKAFAFDSSAAEKECDLVIYPKEENRTTIHYLTWKITLSRLLPLQEIIYFVDAQNGTIVDQKSNIMQLQISGRVTGNYWPVHNYDATVNAGFWTTNIQVYRGSTFIQTVNSDANGNYQTGTNLLNQTHTVKFPLQNSWVQARNSSGSVFISSIQCLPGTGRNLNWGATDGTSARWLASSMHDFFKNNFSYSAMDYQMGAYVGMGSGYNGASDGTNIYFGSQSGQQWVRSSDVVYHEYTHNTIYHLYGGWIGGGGTDCCSEGAAMDEGFADYFSCSKNNDSHGGEDCGGTRNLSNTYTWDGNQDKYFNCQVIGGACWDLRGYVGQTIANNLVFLALQYSSHAHTFHDFEVNVITIDANTYHWAHYTQINQAFANHGIIY